MAELTDAAHNFIMRENYEKALILLQKTEGVLEVSGPVLTNVGGKSERLFAGQVYLIRQLQQYGHVFLKVSGSQLTYLDWECWMSAFCI